jgi:hypothetical protein
MRLVRWPSHRRPFVRTAFDVPATIERGPSNLIVIANGIQSQPVAVTLK